MRQYIAALLCLEAQLHPARLEIFRVRDAAHLKITPLPRCPHLDVVRFGSGVALARLFVALIETYQQADGSVSIPEPLQPYLKADRITA